MKRDAGPARGLESRFRPAAHWGAEFLAAGARLCAFAAGKSGPEQVRAFAGTYAEAEAFARAEGLAWEGLHAAVSHLPFKLEPLGPDSGSGEDESAAVAERARPQGLPAESMEAQEFQAGSGRVLALARADAVTGFAAGLPPSLRALWDLAPSPLALLPHLDAAKAVGHWAALWSEADYTHLLFFRGPELLAYAKPFAGHADAARDAEAFAREMKKSLVYHFGSRFQGASLDGLQVWNDGPAGQVGAALAGLGIPRFQPDWGPLAALPPEFRVAAALALRAARGDEASGSFAIAHPAAAHARRTWRERARRLVRAGVPVAAFMALIAGLLAGSAIAFRLVVQAKAKDWSSELGRWEAFQQRKAEVERELGGMREILERRTASHAALQQASARIPAETWLERWEIESAAGKRASQRLEGFALSEARVPELLSGLERSGTGGAWKLKSTERVKGETVRQKTGIEANRRDLVRFQIGTAQ